MPALGRHARLSLIAGLLAFVAVADARSAAPPAELRATRPTGDLPDDLRATAEAAERNHDWETAFSLYCRVLLADRSPAARDKVASTLRRAQQVRRHRDPAFQQFVAALTLPDALNLYAEVLGRLPTLYADRDRAAPRHLWAHGVEEFDRAFDGPAFRRLYLNDDVAADRVTAFRRSLRETWARKPVANAAEARSLLRRLTAAAADAVPLRSPVAVVAEFVCGACAGLDEYTAFLAPSPAAVDDAASMPDLRDYGLYVAFRDGGLWVDGVVPNSWATFHTSVRKGDRLVRVNGRPFAPGSAAELADALRQPSDGLHRLDVVAAGFDGPTVVELPAVAPTVYGAALLDEKDGVGYVRLAAFRDATGRELDEVLLSLKARGMRSLVLDLRGNHGGPFAAGVQVTQRFLPAGIIVTTRGQVAEFADRVFSSDSGLAASDMPLVLLIDGETASAAEVVAGALKDNQRATLVGLPTFGKGSVQSPFRLVALDGGDAGRPRVGALRVTVARLVSPRGTAITGHGVTPHVTEADPQRQLVLAVARALELMAAGPVVSPPTAP